MAEKKIKISNILGSQLPEFIKEENPLFSEFLEQYYISEEREYGSTYLADNLDKLKDVTTYSRITYAATPATVTDDVLNFDDEIEVSSTAGFPSSYGLLKIDNEIITYTAKTATTFTGCIRGFSGIDKIEGDLQPEFLNFNSSETGSHATGTVVENLSLLFANEFYRKYKSTFLPGFEERQFQQVKIENILAKARDFYSSKGTDAALKILFSVLFKKSVDIIKPFDNTIRPSAANWSVTDDVIVDVISGDPSKLKLTTILQGSTISPTASGSVANVREVFLKKKRYFRISFTNDSISNKFEVSKSTRVSGIGNSLSTLTVDSTLGFPESGAFLTKNKVDQLVRVFYSSKSANQFFGCRGIPTSVDANSIEKTTLEENSQVIDDVFLYGYEDNDITKLVQMRVVGIVSGLSDNSELTKFFSPGDEVRVKHLGEKVGSGFKYNSWFYNNVSYLDVSGIAGSNIVITPIDHYLKKGDRVDILLKEDRGAVLSNIEVSSVINSQRFQIGSGSLINGVEYIIRKRVSFVSTNLIDGDIVGNIQNAFVDSDKNTYVAFSGYPSYPAIDTTDRSKTFANTSLNATSNEFSIPSHGFINGERVHYECTSGQSGITDGNYFVKFIDTNTIKLADSRSALEKESFTNITGISAGSSHKLTPTDLHGLKLVNQSNFKRIYKDPKPVENNLEITGPIGVGLNGVELHSPISEDAYYYGQIDEVSVLRGGSNYDVINSPQVSVADTVGSGFVAHGNFVGKVHSIELTSNGFDYAETPVVKVTGGNGTRAICEARLKNFTHSTSFTDFDIDLNNDRVTLSEDHRFLDGEEIEYIATGTPIGIGSTNVGFGTDRLTSNGIYFVAKHSDTSLSLASTKERALSKQNLIDFNSNGNRQHTLRSRKNRRVIDTIEVTSTDDFANKKVIIDSVAYPPAEQKNIFSTFVGINTTGNYIFAKNHSFNDGDLVVYSSTGSAISGLVISSAYKVKVIDKDRFKLSDAGTTSNVDTTNYDRQIYVNLNDLGSGTHTFKYPDIEVTIDGIVSAGTSSIPSYYNAVGVPVVTGTLESVFVKSGGSGFGSEDIVNYVKDPGVKLLTGKDADIRPIISSGTIISVYIANGGSEYTTPPTINVIGDGTLAKLKANIVNGSIASVDIISGGKNYVDGSTVIEVLTTGGGVRLDSQLHKWSINNVKRFEQVLGNTNFRDTIQVKSSSSAKQLKLASFYPGKFYRNLLNDNINDSNANDLKEVSSPSHSPIIGWAYDGNPIYGPYGNGKAIPDAQGAGGIKKIYSSYQVDEVTTTDLRPSGFNGGYFVQDYVYVANGDLDEYNGRFLVNNDFPQGTYAYFATLDVNGNLSYPYITTKHRNATDKFNYNSLIDQSNEYLNTGDYSRVVDHLGINESFREYPLLKDSIDSQPVIRVDSVKQSRIDEVTVKDSGFDYKVGQQVNLTDSTVDVEISEIIGKDINSIQTTDTVVNNISFKVEGNSVTGFTTVPHGFLNLDVVEISGISSASYKNIEGSRVVGVNTVNTTLAVSIANTATTGLTTLIELSESTLTRKFTKNDVITIGTERMLILDVDSVNNRYRVARMHDGTPGGTHSNGTTVVNNPKSFTFDIFKKLENKNVEFGYNQNFDPSASVGFGSTATTVVVGTAGSSNVTKTISPKAIYLPDHRFKTGDRLAYSVIGVGATLFTARTAALTPEIKIEDYSDLFSVRLSKDFIGISTVKGSSSTIHFVSALGDDHRFEVVKDNLLGSAKKVSAQIGVSTAHNLIVGDNVRFALTPNLIKNYTFKFNETTKNIIVDPIEFNSSAISIGSTVSTISIPNHGLKTGDIVVYTNSVGIATPLSNNRKYYVIKQSDSLIKLASTKYDTTVFPFNHIGITTTGSGTHQIARINPRLELTKGNTVSIATSDTSLSGYDINFYLDEEFKSRYESTLISKVGTIGNGDVNTKIQISVSDSLPKNLFYRIEGDDSNYTNTFPSSVDEDVNQYSNISVVESKFNKLHRVTGVGDTTFTITLVGTAETSSYTSSGFSSSLYSTDSKTAFGGIFKLKIINPGKQLRILPEVVSIGSTTGKLARLEVVSSEIGEVVDTSILEPGLEFLSDKTLKPKADANLILRLKNASTLKSIGISTGGKNYTTAPRVIAIGRSSIITETTLQSSSVLSIDILANDTNLPNDLRLIPTVNSNGVNVIGATSNSNLNVLSLRAPVAGFTEFPFAVGDEIFVENVKITNNADGYNSSDYEYRNFTVTGINTVSGTESVTYSIAGLGTDGGTFDSTNTFGRVIKVSDLAAFEPEFDRITFFDGEKISNADGSAFGFVSSDGWQSDQSTLKLKNVIGTFSDDDVIIGSDSNSKATVDQIFDFDFNISVGSVLQDVSEWKDDVGKLNLDTQRIHDNDYYQRFSYSIHGEVPYETWKEPVNSLDHASGFKNFSDLEIINGEGVHAGVSSVVDPDIAFDVELIEDASVHTISNYDLASENTDIPGLSKIITFDSKIITDYNESRTNKVLKIDDISPQFTGVSTSVGGGIVGLSTFALLNDSNTILYHTFNPASAINTANGYITIPNHEFNTGEKIIYSPTDNGEYPGSEIGIVTTSSPGIGVASTDKLPSTLYAIRIDKDNIKVAIGASEASNGTGIGVTFVTITGLGATHSLAVDSDLASSRVIITVDNIIQSPLSRKVISVGLSSEVGIGTDIVYLNDVSNISGNSLIKIENEILKVKLVGIGSTNSLSVLRGQMGSVAAAHTVGAATTVLSGDYRVNHGNIYFKDAPYGPTGIGSLTTRSSFSGRAYYRKDYSTNMIIDDISEQFDGSTDKFDLTTNSQTVTGIQSSFGAFLVNNIFQNPFFGDVGSLSRCDYQIVGTGQTIDFTGTSANQDLPKGGIINEFSVNSGSGYQSPSRALAVATLNAGAIQSVAVGVGSTGVRSAGGGYISAPLVSIADSTGSGAVVTATIGAGGTVTGFTVTTPGSGYSSSARVIVDPPKPYKNIPLSGGNGSGATIDVVVGTGGSITQFDISNRGVGYEVNDVLTLTQLPFNISGISTSHFEVTVKNKYQNKFAGWTFGKLLELDDFSNLFNGTRKTFLLTRTVVSTEYYSIVAEDGSGIKLANNLMIFLNDVLQKPDDDYEFTGGTRLTFKDAPISGSKLRIYFYVGSDEDFVEVDVDQSIKPGDKLRLQYKKPVRSQDERIIYELIAADTVETQTYGGVGIVTDGAFSRPIEWTKQVDDIIIDGQIVSKSRDYLEPQITPSTNIIASVSTTDTKINVEDTWAFKRIDDLGSALNDIRIVGIGTTAVVEKFEQVSYQGDFGDVIGIATVATGVNTTSPAIEFEFRSDAGIYNATPNSLQVSKPGISVGDYFVIRNTVIGSGVTSILDHENTVVSVGTSFLDNVYYAHSVVSVGSSLVKVKSNVKSIAGFTTTTLPDHDTHGSFSWGSITVTRNAGTAKSFTFQNQNGLVGVETSAHVSRTVQLKTSY